MAPDLEWAKWATFPILLSQTAEAYEAVGTVGVFNNAVIYYWRREGVREMRVKEMGVRC